MADITMCDNRECALRKTCYRFRAEPSDYQSYAIFKPDGDTCKDYVELVRHTRKAKRAVDW